MIVIQKIKTIFNAFFKMLKKTFGVNIATIFFGIIFVYMLVNVFMYLTTDHVETYQVKYGSLSKNPVVTGLVLRDEEIIHADKEGYARYFTREGSVIHKGGDVYALSKTPYEAEKVSLSTEQLKALQDRMADFSKTFHAGNFHDVYTFKYELQGSVFQQVQKEEDTSKEDKNTYKAPSEGIVMYSTDGYEGITPESLREKDLDPKRYESRSLYTNQELQPGDPVYRLVKDNTWYLLFQISDKMADELYDRKQVRVKFAKDDKVETGTLSILEKEEQKLALVTLREGMSRYASDRFLKAKLLLNTTTGLKIPLSSIVTKDFYKIPSSFITKGNNTNSSGFIREVPDGDGEKEFVDAVIFKNTANEIEGELPYAKEDYCYVDTDSLGEGDVLIRENSQETFVVGDTDYLNGVYCMNNGYTLFRQIEILEKNKEYCLVSSDLPYGISIYDMIVLEGDKVADNEFLTGK